MSGKRKKVDYQWSYVFIGYRGELIDGTDFAGAVNLQEKERLYLSLVNDPPLIEGRELDEVRNWAMKTKHQFSRRFYYDGKTFTEL